MLSTSVTFPSSTLRCWGEVLSTLSILMETNSRILKSSALFLNFLIFLLVLAFLVFSDTFMDGIFALILFCWGFQLKVCATCKSATEGCPVLFVFSKGAKRSS